MGESFSIRWDEDEVETEGPIIGVPIRPQPGILRIIGSVLVIGGLLALLSGASNIWTGMADGPTDPAMYEPVALQLQAAGEDITSEEIADRKDKVVSSALDKAAKIKEATEAVDKAYLGDNEKIRRGLIHAAATIENVDRREEEISNMIDDITGGAMRTDKDASLYDCCEYPVL